MLVMKNLTSFFCLMCVLLCGVTAFPQIKFKPALHQTTEWRVSPAFGLDTICFLNILTGDPYYVKRYEKDYAQFEPKLTPAARTAFANLKRKIKDENKQIISAFFALPFSTVETNNLDDLIKNVRDSRRMKSNYQKTVNYDEKDWKIYESLRGDLLTIFLFLKKIEFEKYYRENILPGIQSKIPAIKSQLEKYNVVSEVEKLFHYPLATNVIAVNLLNFSRPHGIRVTGIRFLTHVDYPFDILFQTSVHELMHPPFDLKNDEELKKALDTLRADEFLMDKVKNHNPSFGYNTFEGFVEEDCVKALEQIIEEKYRMETEARKKWLESDDGIHVFAVALYSVMKQEKFDGSTESFRDFLLRVINSGKLSAGKIKPLYDAFYAQ